MACPFRVSGGGGFYRVNHHLIKPLSPLSPSWLCWLLTGGLANLNLTGVSSNNYQRSLLQTANNNAPGPTGLASTLYPIKPELHCRAADWSACGGPIMNAANYCEDNVRVVGELGCG